LMDIIHNHRILCGEYAPYSPQSQFYSPHIMR
jgi:hypothetical protein